MSFDVKLMNFRSSLAAPFLESIVKKRSLHFEVSNPTFRALIILLSVGNFVGQRDRS